MAAGRGNGGGGGEKTGLDQPLAEAGSQRDMGHIMAVAGTDGTRPRRRALEKAKVSLTCIAAIAYTNGWYLKSARFGEVDPSKIAADMRGNADNMEVVFSKRSANLTGTVKGPQTAQQPDADGQQATPAAADGARLCDCFGS